MDMLVLLYLLLVSEVSTRTLDHQLTLELSGYIEGITLSGEIDGYALASVYAVDSATLEDKRQTKLDISEFASNSTSDKQRFSLLLTSGEKLRMSLTRKSIDTSATTVIENTEEDNREIPLQPGDCFFSGSLENEEGFASVSMCEGHLMGSISTSKRTYELHRLPENIEVEQSSDDTLLVLVTWQDSDKAALKGSLFDLEGLSSKTLDGLEIPEDEKEDDSDKPQVVKRSIAERRITVEVADYLDSDFLNDLKDRLNLTTNHDITNLIILKWSSVATMLSDKQWIGWDITLKLKKIEIWRKNPKWYLTKSTDQMYHRMKKICEGTNSLNYDHVTVHTGNVRDDRPGLAWIGGVCRSQYRCGAVRAPRMDFAIELHEFGHSLGLDHDDRMSVCNDDPDSEPGFMGGNKYHVRGCYRTMFNQCFPIKDCLHSDDNTSPDIKLMPGFYFNETRRRG